MPTEDPVVTSGYITCLRLYDVAYEIDLKLAEDLARNASGATARSQLVTTPAKAVSFGVPPLALTFGAESLRIGAEQVESIAADRLYDFGIAALSLRFSVKEKTWSTFSHFVNEIGQTIGPASNAKIWEKLLDRMRSFFNASLRRPTTIPLDEDYLIATVHAFEEPLTTAMLRERIDLVSLLSGEDRPLADGARQELLRQSFSYYPDDLAVITWDRAFLYEPHRSTDVADVLEIANAQLLEMRAYDELLDAELPRMRNLVEQARRRTNFLSSRRYAKLARQLYGLVSEVTELAERVDNALQVTEDVYLARVYATAINLFRVPNVSAAVDRKLAIIRETYTALHHEAADARAEILEIAVLALIAVEVLLSLVRR